MPAQTIDEVIIRLDEVIKRARSEGSRLGFFATLYRNVTVKVKERIGEGSFEDGPRIERLDVIFANRYLAALEAFRENRETTRCWLVAFQAASKSYPLIIQHLLLGINAHINFDLGIAAAEVAPGSSLASLRSDFELINNILAGMILKVRDNIGELSPWISQLNRIDSTADDKIISFSLNKARSCAWNVALRLNSLPSDLHASELAKLDGEITVLGHLVRHPVGLTAKALLAAIRLRESNDVPRIIDVLSQV